MISKETLEIVSASVIALITLIAVITLSPEIEEHADSSIEVRGGAVYIVATNTLVWQEGVSLILHIIGMMAVLECVGRYANRSLKSFE